MSWGGGGFQSRNAHAKFRVKPSAGSELKEEHRQNGDYYKRLLSFRKKGTSAKREKFQCNLNVITQTSFKCLDYRE
jgi:hypothetical protein